MVLRIVLDVLRRKWLTVGWAVFQFYIFSNMMPRVWPAAGTWATPLACAWFLTIPAGPMLQGREFYQLPVARRTLWLARWWISTAVAVLIATVVLSLTTWLNESRLLAGEHITLFVIFAFLYCSLAMTMTSTSLGREADEPISLNDGPAPGTRSGLMLKALFSKFFVWMLVSLAVPFFFARYLPQTFAEIGVASAVVMIAVAAIGARGYLHNPATEARPSMRAVSETRPTPAGEAAAARPSFSDRFTGLRLWGWLTAQREFTTYALVLAAAAVAALVLASDFREALRIGSALPFSSATPLVTEPITYGALLVFAGMATMLSAPSLRALRALPLSTNQLSLMPAIAGILSATMLWAVLLLVHAFVLGSAPASLRLELFASVAGVLSSARMIRTAMPGSMWLRSMVSTTPAMAAFLVVLPFSSWPADVVRPAMLAVGFALVALSFVVTRWSLQRSSSVYKAQWFGVRV